MRYQVDFVVVGGVCAALHGAPLTTFDLDVVHSREQRNIERLLNALAELDAYYRIQPDRRLRPGATHLGSPGHQLLLTRYGPLDLLGEIGGGHDYNELIEHSTQMEIGQGLRARVLTLDALIRTKEEVGSEKDLASLPLLRRVLDEARES